MSHFENSVRRTYHLSRLQIAVFNLKLCVIFAVRLSAYNRFNVDRLIHVSTHLGSVADTAEEYMGESS
jgi:hypothetical protein